MHVVGGCHGEAACVKPCNQEPAGPYSHCILPVCISTISIMRCGQNLIIAPRVPYRFAWFVIVYMAWFSVSFFANPPLGLHDFVQIHANSTFWMITRRLLIMYMNANLKGHDMYNGYKL